MLCSSFGIFFYGPVWSSEELKKKTEHEGLYHFEGAKKHFESICYLFSPAQSILGWKKGKEKPQILPAKKEGRKDAIQ